MARTRILAVENDLATRAAVAGLLAHQSLEVTRCGTAEAALIELRKKTFDIVLTDDRLPGHTGTWMALRAHEEGLVTHTRFLLLSEDPAAQMRSWLTVLRKPFGSHGLIRIIARSFPN